MRARDVMTAEVVTVQPDTTVQAIARLMLERRLSAVPVVDSQGNLAGIVSEDDLMRRPESQTERHSAWWLALLSSPEERAARYIKSHGRAAKDVMTHPVITVDESATLEEVAEILERQRIKRVPVLRDGQLAGIVSRADLLRGLATAKVARAATADDETVRTAVLRAIREDAGVQDQFVSITVAHGTVHLWGAVLSEAERDAVRLAAENTSGVRTVDDHLGVIPPQVRSMLWAE